MAAWSKLFMALCARHWRHDRLRAGLTVLGVSLGVAIVVAIQLANGSALKAFDRSVGQVAGSANLHLTGRFGPLDERILPKIESWNSELRASPVVEGYGVLGDGGALRLVGLDLLRPEERMPAKIQDPLKALSGLLVSEGLARSQGWQVGDRVAMAVHDRRVRVSIGAILPQKTLDDRVALLDISLAQELLGRMGRLDRIDVTVPDDRLSSVRAWLAAELPDVKGETSGERGQQLAKMTRAFRINLSALSFIALLVGAFLVYNAISVSVVRRRPDVAILRTVGASRRQILGAFLGEALVLGGLGSGLGLALGVLLAHATVGGIARTIDALYVPVAAAPVVVDPVLLLGGGVVGIGISLLAACVPAWEAARTPPALATRQGSWEAKRRTVGGRAAWVGFGFWGASLLFIPLPPLAGIPLGGFAAALCLLLGTTFLTPMTIQLGGKGLARVASQLGGAPGRLAGGHFLSQVGRNTVAVSALMVGLAMLLSMAVMIHSFRHSVVDWVDDLLKADLYVKPLARLHSHYGGELSPDVVRTVRALPQVHAVDPYVERGLTHRGEPILVGGGDIRVLARYGHLPLIGGVRLSDLEARLREAGHVLISEPLREKFGYQAGDVVVLETPRGPARLKVAAVFRSFGSEFGAMTMDWRTFERWFGPQSPTSLAVYLKPEASPEAVRQHLLEAVGQERALEVYSNRSLKAEVLKIFDATFAVTQALQAIAMLVAVMGIVTTLSTQVWERRKELAVLKQLGMAPRQMWQMLGWEAGLIGVTGIGLGTLAGSALTWILIAVINKQSFGWSIGIHVPAGLVLETWGVVLVTTILAAFYPARLATRIPIAEAVRSE